jgi:hypothetical protein
MSYQEESCPIQNSFITSDKKKKMLEDETVVRT